MTETKLSIPDLTDEEIIDVCSALENAVGIAYDGCHKIYIIMDDAEYQRFLKNDWDQVKEKDYDPESFESMLLKVPHPTDKNFRKTIDLIIEWYFDSCPLVFINTAKDNSGECLVQQTLTKEWEKYAKAKEEKK